MSARHRGIRSLPELAWHASLHLPLIYPSHSLISMHKRKRHSTDIARETERKRGKLTRCTCVCSTLRMQLSARVNPRSRYKTTEHHRSIERAQLTALRQRINARAERHTERLALADGLRTLAPNTFSVSISTDTHRSLLTHNSEDKGFILF